MSKHSAQLETLRQRIAELEEKSRVTRCSAEQRLSAIVDAVHDGLWEDDFHTGEFFFSRKMFTMLGYQPTAGRDAYEFLRSKCHLEDKIIADRELKRLESGEIDSLTLTMRMIAADGSWKYILSRGNCIGRDEKGCGYHYVGVHTDITRQVETEEALRRAYDEMEDRVAARTAELKETNDRLMAEIAERVRVEAERDSLAECLRQAEKLEAIGQLAGGIAHDFNNQLAGIMGFADILVNELKGNPECLSYAECIINASKRAADLTAQMLAFARKGKHLATSVDMHQVISEVITMLDRGTPSKRIRILANLKADPAGVVGDPGQLQNALLNVAINARDAITDRGEISFSTIRVLMDADDCRSYPYELVPGEYLEIQIADSGQGMDQKTMARVFEPFFTTKAEGKGTGMGLAAVYGTVRSHNGVVTVSSEPGKGSTFKILLPSPPGVQLERPEKLAAIEHRHGNNWILVVDDERIACMASGETLRKLGYGVVSCNGGAEAVEYFGKNWRQIDLVVLDMIMPGLAGPEVFAAMRQINPEAKIMLASGYSLNQEAQALLDAGAAGFIQKPYDFAAISDFVASILAK